MKAKWFLLAGLSVMMLGACSSDDDPSATPESKPTIEGEGKMILDLKFAGGALSRAEDGFGGFDEGTGNESKVRDAYVYFFENSGGNAFLGCSTAKIITDNPSTGTGENVERNIEATVPANVVQKVWSGESAKANIIVVLNKPASLSDKGFTDYAAFNKALEFTAEGSDKDHAGFMMSSTTYKGTDDIQYFVEITQKNIAEEGGGTKPEAVTVYVERVCGKVTLNVNQDLEKNETAKIDLKDWGLNVKNKKVYPVKVLTQEFVGIQESTWPGADNWNAASNFRSYWAIDPNYDKLAENDFNIIKFANLTSKQGASEYCLENTFNHENQMRNQSTTAVIYAQYTPTFEGGTTVPTEHQTWIEMNNNFYAEATFVGNFLKQENIYKKEGEKFVSPAGGDVLFTYKKVTIGEGDKAQTVGGTDYKLAAKTGEGAVTLYKFTGNDITNAKPEEFTEYKDTEWTALNTEFTTYCADARIYINGYCYYEIPVRHFSNAEVPLAADNINSASQLGRYGIVRNHSYQLTINKVLNPGKPIEGETIEPEDGPDDPTPDYYMDVTIKVLSWAVRNQGVDL